MALHRVCPASSRERRAFIASVIARRAASADWWSAGVSSQVRDRRALDRGAALGEVDMEVIAVQRVVVRREHDVPRTRGLERTDQLMEEGVLAGLGRIGAGLVRRGIDDPVGLDRCLLY